MQKEINMNTHRALRNPRIERVIAALILLAAGGVAILITFAWPLIHVSSGQAASQTYAGQVVNDFHVAINSNNVDDVLALFTDNATVTDNKSVKKGRDQIRDWVLYSKLMAGLRLRMFHSEMDGEKITWLDTAHNGLVGHNRYYIVQWNAVIADGKIQNIVVLPKYLPDLK